MKYYFFPFLLLASITYGQIQRIDVPIEDLNDTGIVLGSYHIKPTKKAKFETAFGSDVFLRLGYDLKNNDKFYFILQSNTDAFRFIKNVSLITNSGLQIICVDRDNTTYTNVVDGVIETGKVYFLLKNEYNDIMQKGLFNVLFNVELLVYDNESHSPPHTVQIYTRKTNIQFGKKTRAEIASEIKETEDNIRNENKKMRLAAMGINSCNSIVKGEIANLEIINCDVPDVRYKYESSGTITIDIIVDASGTVTKANFSAKYSNINNSEEQLRECLRVARRWKFKGWITPYEEEEKEFAKQREEIDKGVKEEIALIQGKIDAINAENEKQNNERKQLSKDIKDIAELRALEEKWYLERQKKQMSIMKLQNEIDSTIRIRASENKFKVGFHKHNASENSIKNGYLVFKYP
jgi:hypothetical protein